MIAAHTRFENASAAKNALPLFRTEPVSSCPVCHQNMINSEMELYDYLHGVPGCFTYTRCGGCGSVYQNPRVVSDDLTLCYPAEYYTHSKPAFSMPVVAAGERRLRTLLRNAIHHYADDAPLVSMPWPVRVLGRVLAHVPITRKRARYGLADQLRKGGQGLDRCLEVGPGQGIELAQLRAIGWEAIGLDADPLAAENARQLSNCDVHVGTLATAPFPPDYFRLIYMRHVLEHLPDLEISLRRARELLTVEGRLVLIYPNPDSLATRWYRQYSCNWDPPRHLVLPSCSGIGALLVRIGFRTVKVTTSARRAAAFRAIALAYRGGIRGGGFIGRKRAFNPVFKYLELAVTLCGWTVGEEVIVTASK
jgi:SAM-dependent methyltransferase